MKILVTGADGQLGNALRANPNTHSLGEIIWSSRRALHADGDSVLLDLAAPGAIARSLDAIAPDIIVNTAAYTAVDKAEAEESLATVINGEAVGEIGAWASANGALVIHISTDYVFDGLSDRPYAVDAKTSPKNAYGRSKLAGELALQESGAKAIILRTAWLYAKSGKNFMNTMLRLAKERDAISVVADQIGSPTPAAVLADAVVECISRWQATSPSERVDLLGMYHIVTSGKTSWHGFAKAIIDGAWARGLIASAPFVTPIGTGDFPTPARRPPYSVLDNSRFEVNFARKLPRWEDALASTLDELIP